MADCCSGDMILSTMRSKNFLILLLFILATTISVWLVNLPSPNIRNIMSETHKQITNLKTINVIASQNDGFDIDETYLELLGFNGDPKLYPEAFEKKDALPVVVTGVRSNEYENALKLLKSVKKHLPRNKMVIYDLLMNSYELLQLKKKCNTSTNCLVKSFPFEKFPSHLRDYNIKAFSPIAIQEVLNEYGAVIWVDGSLTDTFNTSSISKILDSAKKTGIVAWRIESKEPTSARTHPRMFTYFKTSPSKYHFLHMVDSSHLVLYNTKRLHKELMLPWVECALKVQCIWPTGAQDVGCNLDRKPLYTYSGCHDYSMSALNVILGVVFKYDDRPYTVYDRIFGVERVNESTTPKMTTKNQFNSRSGSVVGVSG